MRTLSLCCLVSMLSAAAQAATVADTPFRNNVNFYIVNGKGAAFAVRVLTDAQTQQPDRGGFNAWLMMRVYGPDDRLVLAREEQLEETQRAEFRIDVPAGAPGTYTLMLTGGAPDWVGIKLEPALGYGVMGRSRLRVRGSALAKRYLYVPRNCREAQIQIRQAPPRGHRTLVVFDEKNAMKAAVRSVIGLNVIRLEPTVRDVAWRVEITGKGDYDLDCAGLPGILCPNPDVAKQIRASAIYLDGVTVQHQWQAKMWELLKAIKPEEMAIGAQPLDAESLIAGGRRAAFALGPYGPLSNLPLVLAEQNLAPASHWFGSIHAWRDPRTGEPRTDRWDDCAAGYANAAGAAGVLAWAYGTSLSGNPYYKRPALLKRAMAASLLHYLAMNEAEEIAEPGMIFEGERDWQHYPFRYLADGPGVLLYLLDDAPPEAKAVWIEAVRRQAERLAYFPGDSTSQWAAIGLAHCLTAMVTGEPRYEALWRRHVECLLADDMGHRLGQSPAGYFRESGGADGGYNSVTSFYLGCLYRLTEEPELLAALLRSWDLRSHLTLPEPDGRLVSPTNFNTRTRISFACGLYPDAALQMGWIARADDWLLRHKSPGPALPWLTQTLPDLERVADYWTSHALSCWSTAGASGSFHISGLLTCLAKDAFAQGEAALPVEASDRFVKDFAGEFVCVRRPAYYAIVYTAQRGPEPDMASVMQGGGLSALWTPDCGTVLLGANRSPWFNHGITGVVRLDETVSSSFADARAKLGVSTLTVSGQIPTTPLRYERSYRFDDSAVAVTLTVTAARAWTCRELHEVIPYYAGDGKELRGLGPYGSDLALTPDARQRAMGFAVVCDKGLVDVEFAEPVELTAGSISAQTSDATVRSVLARLPTKWDAGQRAVLSYVIRPGKRGD